MMKRCSLLCACLLIALSISAQQTPAPKEYGVAFYNIENLFDTIHDAGKNDAEFLPNGSYEWNTRKYVAKLKNMARVIHELARDRVAAGAAVVGLAEVENDRVLDDLVNQPALKDFRYIHYEGPDRRGIDCALLYNPELFTPHRSKLVLSTPFQGDTVHLTRGFLIVEGELGGEDICFIVNHWPSRGAASPVRVHAAEQVKALKDSLMRVHKKLNLVIMGDLNDDPMDESLQVLGAKKYVHEVKKHDLFNPWWTTLQDDGVGTLEYRGKWNLFDQILLSRPLLKAKKGLCYDGHEVFRREYLIQQSGRYKGTPLRTHGGRTWLNGYSDHLPTIIYLKKK
jgi:predicted extracellular nuclease